MDRHCNCSAHNFQNNGPLAETAIAYRFGTTVAADAPDGCAAAANTVSCFSDAVKTAFIPIYSQYHEKKTASLAFTAYVISGGIILLLAGFWSFCSRSGTPGSPRLYGQGLHADGDHVAHPFTRALSSGWRAGRRNPAHKEEFYCSRPDRLSKQPDHHNFYSFFGAGYGIPAWLGHLAGFASQFLIQLPALLKHGIFSQRKFLWRHPESGKWQF